MAGADSTRFRHARPERTLRLSDQILRRHFAAPRDAPRHGSRIRPSLDGDRSGGRDVHATFASAHGADQDRIRWRRSRHRRARHAGASHAALAPKRSSMRGRSARPYGAIPSLHSTRANTSRNGSARFSAFPRGSCVFRRPRVAMSATNGPRRTARTRVSRTVSAAGGQPGIARRSQRASIGEGRAGHRSQSLPAESRDRRARCVRRGFCRRHADSRAGPATCNCGS